MSLPSFDPTSFLREDAPPRGGAEIVMPWGERTSTCDVPPAWIDGLRALDRRRLPAGAHPERWAEIVRDAWRVAFVFRRQVIEAGWSTENLFGFESGRPDLGLAVALRGRRLIDVRPDQGTLFSPEGEGWRYETFRPRMPDGCRLLWNFPDANGDR